MELILRLMTNTQLCSMMRKVYHKMTEGSGYQPFGWDITTMRLTHPEELEALLAIRAEIKRRVTSGKACRPWHRNRLVPGGSR